MFSIAKLWVRILGVLRSVDEVLDPLDEFTGIADPLAPLEELAQLGFEAIAVRSSLPLACLADIVNEPSARAWNNPYVDTTPQS
jgi:hypothetical protein